MKMLFFSNERNIISLVGGARDMDYMTLKEASTIWGISPRMINYYCTAGRIVGAVKMGTVWVIPKNSEKPIDGRTKQRWRQVHE
jgi:hypothetical protein